MELDTIAKHTALAYRLLDTTSADDALVENGETAGDVVYLGLTEGYREAQRWLLEHGMTDRWRSKSAALSWTTETEGTKYAALPSGFIRLDGDRRRSALVEANGDPWGSEVDIRDDRLEGDFYFLQNERIYLCRQASPPTTLYLRYHAEHAAITSGTTTFDLPAQARYMAVAMGCATIADEGWMSAGPEAIARIDRAVARGKQKARSIARRTRAPREFQRPQRYGNHW